MPALAGLLIVVGVQTLKPREIETTWKTGPVQAMAMVATFVGSLLVPLQYAVMIGVALSVMLFVIRQSNKVVMKEWVLQQGELAVEQEAPRELPGGKTTVLVPYGSLFFAAAATLEKQLPVTTSASRRAVALLNLRNRTELGSTFIEILERYAGELREVGGRLMLVEVDEETIVQFYRIGQMKVFGRENVLKASDLVGESVYEGLDIAERWLEETREE